MNLRDLSSKCLDESGIRSIGMRPLIMLRGFASALRAHLLLMLAWSVCCASFGQSAATSNSSPRERIPFNDGWVFHKVAPTNVHASLNYTNLKPWVLPSANALLATNRFPAPVDDERRKQESWAEAVHAECLVNPAAARVVSLPHDWGIEGPFKQEYPGETGKLPWWGVAWYRKHFVVPANDAGRRFVLEVDGAMAYATVWCNGKLVGGWPYGYASWQLDLTPFIRVGGDNTLAIRLDNPEESSRWYPGGGLYRNVWLTKTDPVHIAQWGVFVTTPEVNRDSAIVQVQVALDNDSPSAVTATVKAEVYELNTAGVKSKHALTELSAGGIEIASGSNAVTTLQLTIPKPKLWSIAQPNRYVAVTTLEQGGKLVDRVETPFGIRTFEFTADNGFLLNGVRVPLQGVCNHHDLGALGAAFNVRAAERQLEILQEMGVNAIRTSHNPPAPELLDLCDRMGFVVMDEAFDCWKGRKKKNDYHLLFPDWHEADLRALVRRDRNHPCVILWSTGNEMPDQRSREGIELSKRLTAIVKDEDPTRPVTAGCNHDVAGFNGFQNTVDVFGYNYKPQLYARFRATNSAIPLISSESSSCVSTRGDYFFPVNTNKLEGRQDWQVSSYDLYAPRWAMPPDWEFRGQDTNPFVGGEFVWTGFDYLGEPTPYNDDLTILFNYTDPAERARVEQELKELGKIRVPSRSSYFGIVDLAGFKKDRFYIYQARWRPELPMAHILPHWNWPGREGEVTPVHVYTSGDEAELFLNGKSLGRKKRGPLEYRLHWDDVKYAPGELKVVAYMNGKRWAQDAVKTTGPAAKLVLSVDRSRIRADGDDLAFVTVAVADQQDRAVPRSMNEIRFEIEGPGEIVATDNGDPTSHESFQSPVRKAFNGLALAIVRSQPGATGPITVKANAAGLEGATIKLHSGMAN